MQLSVLCSYVSEFNWKFHFIDYWYAMKLSIRARSQPVLFFFKEKTMRQTKPSESSEILGWTHRWCRACTSRNRRSAGESECMIDRSALLRGRPWNMFKRMENQVQRSLSLAVRFTQDQTWSIRQYKWLIKRHSLHVVNHCAECKQDTFCQ